MIGQAGDVRRYDDQVRTDLLCGRNQGIVEIDGRIVALQGDAVDLDIIVLRSLRRPGL